MIFPLSGEGPVVTTGRVKKKLAISGTSFAACPPLAIAVAFATQSMTATEHTRRFARPWPAAHIGAPCYHEGALDERSSPVWVVLMAGIGILLKPKSPPRKKN